MAYYGGLSVCTGMLGKACSTFSQSRPALIVEADESSGSDSDSDIKDRNRQRLQSRQAWQPALYALSASEHVPLSGSSQPWWDQPQAASVKPYEGILRDQNCEWFGLQPEVSVPRSASSENHVKKAMLEDADGRVKAHMHKALRAVEAWIGKHMGKCVLGVLDTVRDSFTVSSRLLI